MVAPAGVQRLMWLPLRVFERLARFTSFARQASPDLPPHAIDVDIGVSFQMLFKTPAAPQASGSDNVFIPRVLFVIHARVDIKIGKVDAFLKFAWAHALFFKGEFFCAEHDACLVVHVCTRFVPVEARHEEVNSKVALVPTDKEGIVDVRLYHVRGRG